MREHNENHDQGDNVEKQSEADDVLDPFGTYVSEGQGPYGGDDSERQAPRFCFRANGGQKKRCSDEGVNGHPSDLEQTHQDTGHDVAATGAESGTADYIERIASLHTEGGRDAIKECIAD